MAGKGVVRSLKNYAKGFSDVQIKVRKATSNDPWGPSGTLMNEIAQLTYNKHEFIEVMDMIDKRLNDKGKNWRHVFKALLLLDYCLHVGSENVVVYAKENSYVVKTLRDFQHVDETGKDVGSNVRQKAKDIVNLLQDDLRLQEERRQRKRMRERMAGVGDCMNEMSLETRPDRGRDDDDDEFRRALEESKRLAEEEEKKRRQGETDELNKALQLSEQEVKQNQPPPNNFDAIFASQPTAEQPQQPLQIGWTQDAAFFQPPSNTNNPYMQSAQTLVPMQPTGFQHPQPAGFSSSPFTQDAQQTVFTQPSASSFDAFGSTMMPPSNSPFAAFATPATSSPFSANTSAFQPDASFANVSQTPFGASFDQTLVQSAFSSNSPFQQQSPAMAGSRNPFSQSSPQPAPAVPVQQPSTFELFAASLEANKHTLQQANNAKPASSPMFTTASMPSASSTSPAVAKKDLSNVDDARYAKLNSLLANRADDGLDTYGNTGTLRIPVGSGFANSMKSQDSNLMANAADNKQRTGFDEAFGLPNSSATQNPFQQPSSPFATTLT
ncbi:ENTH-domain-containing protein [Hesseltinella vesiculosa]|uniref:ENTH-domain-containing protein n=1 Tax=Hesseltinella vesiculosa TaxID=101127 RepID=A0A1X2GGD1_9FUNG|nr:ENTH-domain-containing protein [Hesseltinella vesiculosa]